MAAVTWAMPSVSESVSASSLTPQSAECAAGVTPNVVGQVTDVDGLPYSTRVRLWGSAVANPTFQFGESFLGETTSDSNGNFGFCFDLFGNPEVNALQIVGVSKSADYERQGHSGSPFVQPFDCSTSCDIDVQLAEPTVIFDFDESIDRVEQYVSISGQILHFGPLDSENRGSFAFRNFTPGISWRSHPPKVLGWAETPSSSRGLALSPGPRP
ncbi:MAG: hypothetical protein O2925_10550 [Actinomycetota bacterium]|nr:hypothetical protein [Actinomycetota bacterium]